MPILASFGAVEGCRPILIRNSMAFISALRGRGSVFEIMPSKIYKLLDGSDVVRVVVIRPIIIDPASPSVGRVVSEMGILRQQFPNPLVWARLST